LVIRYPPHYEQFNNSTRRACFSYALKDLEVAPSEDRRWHDLAVEPRDQWHGLFKDQGLGKLIGGNAGVRSNDERQEFRVRRDQDGAICGGPSTGSELMCGRGELFEFGCGEHVLDLVMQIAASRRSIGELFRQVSVVGIDQDRLTALHEGVVTDLGVLAAPVALSGFHPVLGNNVGAAKSLLMLRDPLENGSHPILVDTVHGVLEAICAFRIPNLQRVMRFQI